MRGWALGIGALLVGGCGGESRAAGLPLAVAGAGVAEGWDVGFDAVAEAGRDPEPSPRQHLRFAATPDAAFDLEAGAGAVIWRPEDRVKGAYTLTCEVRAAGDGATGILFGGVELEAYCALPPLPRRAPGGEARDEAERAARREAERARSRVRWTAFVVRGDGACAVLAFRGGELHTVSPWSEPVGDAGPTAGSVAGSAFHALEVEVGATATVFRRDGSEVYRARRGALSTDGGFGYRAEVGQGRVGSLDLVRGLR